MIGYSIIRFPLEFLRYQPTPVPLLGLTLVQWLCIASVAWFGTRYYLRSKGPLMSGAASGRWLKRGLNSRDDRQQEVR
jgi:hypothetical protein